MSASINQKATSVVLEIKDVSITVDIDKNPVA